MSSPPPPGGVFVFSFSLTSVTRHSVVSSTGCWPISRHPPGEDNTSPGLPETLGRRFLLLRFGFFDLGSGLRFSGTGACRIPPETSHKSVPPLLPEAWNAFSFCTRRSHSFSKYLVFVGV